MEGREAGEFMPSSDEVDRERQAQERYDEQQLARFRQREADEAKKRLELTPADLERIAQERREREARENDPVNRMLNRPKTPEELREQEMRDLEERRVRREREELQSGPEARAEAARMRQAELDKELERRADMEEQQRGHYDLMREEKAPPEKVAELVAQQSEMRLDEKTTVDLRRAVPAMIERIRSEGGDPHVADALEVNMRTFEELARQALMFGPDQKRNLEDFVRELQSKVVAEARRNRIDLASISSLGPETKAAHEKEAPKDQLDAAFADSGVDAPAVDTFIASLPDGGLISEKKMLTNALKGIKEKIASGGDPATDADLRATMEQFMNDLKRSMERNKSV